MRRSPRETLGRDAAYLRRPRLVAGILVRPLTLRDYLHHSADASPFIAGGEVGRDHVAQLLWDQLVVPLAEGQEKEFAAQFDGVDLAFLRASCREYVDEFMVDAPLGR